MFKNKKIIYGVLIIAIFITAGIVFFSVVCSVKYYNQICPIKLDMLRKPPISGDECSGQSGRIVNTLGGENCSLSEINVGAVKDMKCPCICCVNKN